MQAAIRISFDLSLNTQISYKAYKKRSGRKTFPGIKYYTYTEADTYLQFL